MIPQVTEGDADVVMGFRHATHQAGLLIRGEGQLIIGERLRPISSQIRDHTKVVETPRFEQRV